MGINSCLNVRQKVPVKASGPRFVLFGRSLLAYSLSLLGISLLMFSVTSSFSFGKPHFSTLSNFLAYSFFFTLLYNWWQFCGVDCYFSFSFMVLFIWVISLFFLILWLDVYHIFFNNTGSRFHWSVIFILCLIVCFYFLYYLFLLSILFPSFVWFHFLFAFYLL